MLFLGTQVRFLSPTRLHTALIPRFPMPSSGSLDSRYAGSVNTQAAQTLILIKKLREERRGAEKLE